MNNDSNNGHSRSRILMQDLATSLNELVVREHQILQEELQQLSTLIRDAISTLEKSFHSINDQATDQSRLAISFAETLKDNDLQLTSELDKISVLSEQINNDVAKAVRSLQFEDIIQQLAAHSNNRAQQIEQLFVKLGENLTSLKLIQSEDITQIEEIIASMQSDLEDFRRAVEKDNPVKQASMEEGKIELF